MMDWKNIILILVAGLNLGSSLMVYFKNPKSRINIYYASFVFWVSVWIFGVALFRSIETETGVHLLIYAYYGAAALIPIFFYLFSFYFPYSKRLPTTKIKILVWVGTIAILIDSLPIFLVKDVVLNPPNNIVILNLASYLIYSVIFLTFTIFAFKNLVEKLKESKDFAKTQLRCIVYGSGIAYFFGILFNLIYPFFGDYTMIWLGPYFTVVMIIFLDYLLFFYNVTARMSHR